MLASNHQDQRRLPGWSSARIRHREPQITALDRIQPHILAE